MSLSCFFHFCPQAIETCVAAAGFSVGEFAALVFSGSMNYAEGKHDKDVARSLKIVVGQYFIFIHLRSSSVCSEGTCRGHAESLRAGSQWDAVSHRQTTGPI